MKLFKRFLFFWHNLDIQYQATVDIEKNNIVFIGNHVSYFDFVVLVISHPKKIIFLVDNQKYKKKLNPFWHLLINVIDISNLTDSQIIKIINLAFSKNHSIVFFPEGRVTQNGQINRFNDRYEKIIKLLNNSSPNQPVFIPFYLYGLWGGQYSYASKKTQKAKKSNPNISILFGCSIDENLNLKNIKDKIISLSLIAIERSAKDINSISDYWFNNILSNKKFYIADSTGVKLKARKIFTAVLLLGIFLKKRIVNNKDNLNSQNIGVILPPSVFGSLVNISLLNLGKTICNLNYTSGITELNYAVDLAELKTIITSRKFIEALKNKGFNLTKLLEKAEIIYLEDIKAQTHILTKIKCFLTTFLPTSIIKLFHCEKKNLDETAFILFSSGSENLPKGIELSGQNIIGNVLQCDQMLDAHFDDLLIAALPIFHSFGLTVCTLWPQLRSISTVYHLDPTDGLNVSKMIEENGGTIFFSTPTFLRLYTKNIKINPASFQSLRIIVTGAEKLSSKIRSEFEGKFGLHIYEGYGMSETTPVVSCNIPNQLSNLEDQGQISDKVGTVGKPIVGTKVLIINPNTHEPLKNNQAGMVAIAGVQVMKSYLKDESLTNKVMLKIDGMNYYITGDKGKIDNDGFLTIIDRYSRFAKIAGEMVSFSSLEAEINQYVKDVEICATSVGNEKKGEEIILLYSGEIDVKKLKNKLLANKVNPLHIPNQFIEVEQIPKLGTGKVSFSGVKKLALEMIKDKQSMLSR